MNRSSGIIALFAMSLVVLPSCKKKHSEAVKSDLKEAGYKLTPEDWFRASRENNVSALKKFVSAGFAADTRNAEGNSALHLAAAGGAQGAADLLLKRGLAIDLRGSNERTPLMEAVMADQTEIVRWLLRQGADPRLKDKEGFKPLMLAVREGKSGAVEELAPYDREDLDPALLLAALVGRADVIDSLTNFGSSVYARMEDGRTPLMIAAENGHTESVKLLLDIGASRFTTDPEGRTAADIATAAGHPEIAALITRDASAAELALESPVEIAKSLDQLVNNATAKASATSHGTAPPQAVAAIPIEGETLSTPVASQSASAGKTAVGNTAANAAAGNTAPVSPPEVRAAEAFSMPPLVMRQYREKEVPVQVKSVQGEVATVSLKGAAPRELKVRVGDPIPGSKLVVVRVQRRMEDSKVSLGKPSEISVVEVRDGATGQTREWISGNPSNAHDPVALVEDAATGKRYVAAPGQRFRGGDGAECSAASREAPR